MWHIYTMEYYAAIKKDEFCVVRRDMDESGEHHSQQTDTRTENQTLHVLTHRWVLNNENTGIQGEEHHTLGAVGEGGDRQQGVGSAGRVGRDNMGRNARYSIHLK